MRSSLWIGLAIASFAMLQGQVDPPSRVARLNYVAGAVSFQPAGLEEWVDAQVNRPITLGDKGSSSCSTSEPAGGSWR